MSLPTPESLRHYAELDGMATLSREAALAVADALEECARLRAELAQARDQYNNIRRHLDGHPDSMVEGPNGLAAATMRELRRVRGERDQARAELKELAGHAHDNLTASTAHARAVSIEDAATWVERHMVYQPDVAREVAAGIRGMR